MDPISALLALVPVQYLAYAFAACGLCALLDAVLPAPPAGSRWVGVRGVLHVLGANVLNARNAVPAGAVPASVAAHAAEVRTVAAALEAAAGTLAEAGKGVPEAVPSPHVDGPGAPE